MTSDRSFGERYRARVHRAGMLWNRLVGTFLVVIGGGAALWSVVTLADFSIATHWPVLAMAGVLLVVGRVCFRGRPSFLEMMSEVPLTPAEAAARRRDVAVDDESRR